MLTKRRSDFFYTLKDDQRKCLASIERIDQKIRQRRMTKAESSQHSQNLILYNDVNTRIKRTILLSRCDLFPLHRFKCQNAFHCEILDSDERDREFRIIKYA